MEEIMSEEFLNIGFYWFPVQTLGYGKRLGVWFQGCNKACKDCISPELKVHKEALKISAMDLLGLLAKDEKPDGLTISGGEPFDQPEGLLSLVLCFKKLFNDDILVYSGYTLEQLKKKNSDAINAVLEEIAVLIDGPYEPDKNDGVGIRGSSNQRLCVFRHKERYRDLEKAERELQAVFADGRLWLLGIPGGESEE